MAKAGRKRKFGVSRYPNGREKKKEDARETVVATRMRQFGLNKVDASSDLAGYALGRLALSGALGVDWRPLLDAANGYVNATARYMRVKFPSWPIPKAMDWISAKGLGGDVAPEAVDQIVRRYERYRAILARVDGISRMKFHQIAFDDEGNTRQHTEAVHKCCGAIMEGLVTKPKS